jgi:hypothetical protein
MTWELWTYNDETRDWQIDRFVSEADARKYYRLAMEHGQSADLKCDGKLVDRMRFYQTVKS